jgi:OOP family OmpA-OmpF porin
MARNSALLMAVCAGPIAYTGSRDLIRALAHGTDSRQSARESLGYVRYPADGATLSADNALCPSVSTETQQRSHRKEYTMRNTFTRKHTALAVACALALGIFSVTANAQIPDISNINQKALVVDARGAAVMSGFGECWHTGYGPAPSWTAGCGGVAPVAVAQYVAPAPAPVVVAAVKQPIYEKVAFDANVLFDSDKSALRPAGRDTLDAFAAKIRGLESQSILAIGYADRMGTDAHNQVLSQQRVDAVKDYLVGKGIAANRVQTSAKGESQPTTLLGDCKDANNPTNVACMQPDRHVFIEVSGTRIAN